MRLFYCFRILVVFAVLLPGTAFAELVTYSDDRVFKGRIGELQDDIVKFYADQYVVFQLSLISAVQIEEGLAGEELATQQANVERLQFVISPSPRMKQKVRRNSWEHLLEKRYVELDAIASSFIKEQSLFPNGSWKISDFYRGFGWDVSYRDAIEYQRRAALIEEWIANDPSSPTARVALMSVLVNEAWAKRGSGIGKSVELRAERSYKRLLKQVIEVGDELRKEGARDPQLYDDLITAHMGIGSEKSVIFSLLRELGKIEPGYHHAYMAGVTAVLPKWGGSVEQVHVILDQIAPEQLAEFAPEYYLYFVLNVLNQIRLEDYQNYRFDWEALHAAYAISVKKRGITDLDMHSMAKLAALHEKRKESLDFFKRTQGQWNHFAQGVWKTKEIKERFFQWANESPDITYDTTLAAFFKQKDFGDLVELFKRSPDTFTHSDLFGNTLLHYATRWGYPPLVSVLAPLSDLTSKNIDGLTPLHIAVKSDDFKVAERLLQAGADPGITAYSSELNALHIAASNGFNHSIELVLAARADLINTRAKYGSTSLMLAAANGRTDSVRVLLEHDGIDVEAARSRGQTALTIAVGHGHKYIVRQLIAAGANLNSRDWLGRTPLDLAREEGQKEIASRLLDAGSEANEEAVTISEREKMKELIEQARAQASNNESSIALYRQALKISDNSWYVHYQLGYALWHFDGEEAARHLDRAIALNPMYSELYYWAGRINHTLDRPNKYTPYFTQYIAMAPDTYNTQDLRKNYQHLLGAQPEKVSEKVSSTIEPKYYLAGLAVIVLLGLLVYQRRRLSDY